MATQRTSVKVTRIIEVDSEYIALIILKHFTNGIGDVTYKVSSGGFFKGATIVCETEEPNKTEDI